MTKLLMSALTLFSMSAGASPVFNDGVSSLLREAGLNPAKVQALAQKSNNTVIQFFDPSANEVPCQFTLTINKDERGSLKAIGELMEKTNDGNPKVTQTVRLQGYGMLSSSRRDGPADEDLMEKQIAGHTVKFTRFYFRDDSEDVSARLTLRTETSSGTTSRKIQILSLAFDPKGLTSSWCSLDKAEVSFAFGQKGNIQDLK